MRPSLVVDGTEDELDPPGRPIGRRAFLGVVGFGLTSLAWGGAAADLVAQSTRLLPEQLRAVVPFGKGWRIYAVNPPYPTFDQARWRLRIDGLVEHPQTLTYEALLALPQAQQTSDFVCVTGWSVDDVRWKGVRFADLLALARPTAEAGALNFISAEVPYVDTLTLKQAMGDDVMLAHHMDGRPMKREHGSPTRVVVPKMYGYKGVKWVSRIEVVDVAQPGYWQQRGYDQDAWIDPADAV